MNTVNTLSIGTKAIAGIFAVIALMFAVALPANALVDCSVVSCNDSSQNATGDCSAVINQGPQANVGINTAVSTATSAGVGGASVTGTGGDGIGTANSSATNTNNQANVGPSFSPDCSTNTSSVTNITQQQVAAASAAASAEASTTATSANSFVSQVSAVPAKGVNAGAGGAASSVLPSLAALFGSVASFGYGALRFRKLTE